MVRHYAKKELSGYIRISVGKPEQTDLLLAALRAL
jgi:histidinol-phosphate aminotransferase